MNLKLPLKYKADLQIIAVALLYYFSARLGYFLAFENTTALPTWPPSGIAFALIILLGRSAWPGITIGALVANVMAYWNNPILGPQAIIAISSFIAIGNTLEAVLGNFLVKAWIKDSYPFHHARNTFRFLFVTLFMCLVGSGIGAASLYFNQVITLPDLSKTLVLWWIGNIVGILLFTPFILATGQPIRQRITPGKFLEIGIFLISVLSIYLILQVDYLAVTMERALPFLVLPFLLWLAFRFELIVAITGVVIAALISVYFTVKGIGPFVLTEPYNSMLLLQI